MPMQAPPSSGLSRLPREFSPSSRPPNSTSTPEHCSCMLATSLTANTRRLPHDCIPIPNLPFHGIPSLWNSYSPDMQLLFGGPQGDLVRAPVQHKIDSAPLAPLVPSEPDAERPPKPQGNLLVHVKVVHTPETQMRILRLSKREQAIVLTDGGNTVESQLRVLETIERYSPDHNNQRVWTEAKIPLASGKETIDYVCKATGCISHDMKFQKARQHFVSCHVTEACWGCPIEGCTHAGKYKRLDDLKHHHMVPCHGVEYTRNRKRDTSERLTDASPAGQVALHPANPTSPLPKGQVPTVVTITTPSQFQGQGPASLHTSSQAERGPKKARLTRLKVSAGPSQARRLGRAAAASETTSGHGRDILPGTEASLSNMFYQDITSLGVATPVNVYRNARSPQSHSQQRSPWSNPSGSPAYVGNSLAENPYSPDALGSTHSQPSHSPLGPLLDSIAAYVPQRSAYGELSMPMPTTPQQGSYGHASTPYAPSPIRGHPDPHGMASVYRPPTLSPQGDVDVGAPLRGRVTDAARLSRQDRSSSLVNRVLDDLSFGGGSNFTSPGTQPLVPSPHYNQWGQTGAGLPTNYAYNPSHQLSSSTNMAPTTSSAPYIAPSQSPSRTLGALSSDRSNGRDQALSSVLYAPPQRVAVPTHGFAESGGYLSVPWSGSHSVGGASPTQGTMYHDRMQAPRESTMAYQALGFDGFEIPSPDFGSSPHLAYPHSTLLANPRSSDSFDAFFNPANPWIDSINFGE